MVSHILNIHKWEPESLTIWANWNQVQFCERWDRVRHMLFLLKITWSTICYLLTVFISLYGIKGPLVYTSVDLLLLFPKKGFNFSEQGFEFVDILLSLYKQVCLMGEFSCSTNFGSEAKRKSTAFNCFSLRHSNTSGYYAKQMFFILEI